ncbi:MAG: hypothetical protein R2711_19010 [Acidimicrobiales bacterium]
MPSTARATRSAGGADPDLARRDRRRAGRARRPGRSRDVVARGRRGRAHQPRQVLFPAGPDGVAVTKRDLVRYWAQVAPHALPYLWDRPVNLQRFPDGADAPGFWNKAVAKRAPSWLATWDRPDAKEGKTVTHLVADRPAALAYLANLAALELHPWTAPTRSHRMPTWALIDLDPGPRTTWDELLVLARLHRTALDHLGVAAMPKVTGKRSIQIWIPVADGLAFEDTSRWVQQVSEAIGATVPELVSWAWGTEDRKGLARLDYTRTPTTRRSSALEPPPGRRRAGVGADHLGRARRPRPPSRPVDHPHGARPPRRRRRPAPSPDRGPAAPPEAVVTDEPGGDPRWPRPGEVVPMTATVAERRGAAPGRDLGEGWSFERKLDGYRCLAWVDGPSGGDGVALRSRTGQSSTPRSSSCAPRCATRCSAGRSSTASWWPTKATARASSGCSGASACARRRVPSWWRSASPRSTCSGSTSTTCAPRPRVLRTEALRQVVRPGGSSRSPSPSTATRPRCSPGPAPPAGRG